MERKYHSGNIRKLGANQIFVFGSNLAGIHGAGAALYAKNKFGAASYFGEGLTGQCYALPTKDHKIKTLSASEIEKNVNRFIQFASAKKEYEFLLTPIGCGLAGFKPSQIAPMFSNASVNVTFPPEFNETKRTILPASGIWSRPDLSL